MPDTTASYRVKAVDLLGIYGGVQQPEPEAEGSQTVHVVYYRPPRLGGEPTTDWVPD